MLLFSIPCWATLGSERFGSVAIPASVSELLLFLDRDPAGRKAEARARDAYRNVERVRACYPPLEGDDWNDVLRGQARLTEASALRQSGPEQDPSDRPVFLVRFGAVQMVVKRVIMRIGGLDPYNRVADRTTAVLGAKVELKGAVLEHFGRP